MKCSNCNSCVRLIRVPNTFDNSIGDIMAWYCDVCGNSFLRPNLKVLDKESELYKSIKNKYYELYHKGETI